MSEKVIAVMQKIIDQPADIGEIFNRDNEYFFRYGGYALSILKHETGSSFGGYSFFVYPKWQDSLNALAEQFEGFGDEPGVQYASYRQAEYSREEQDVFPQLYHLIKARHINVDDIFDSILSH